MRKMMSVAAAAAVFMLSVNPVMAADAPAPVISPAKQALLVRLDKAMNFEKMMKDVTGNTMKMVIDSTRQLMPELGAEEANAMAEATQQVSAAYIPKMKEIIFQAYGEVLSEDELTAMVEFYESPHGQAILNKVPQVNQRTMAQMSAISVQMQKEMISKMCEKMTCPQVLKDRVK